MHKFWLFIEKGKLVRESNNYVYITISNTDTKLVHFFKSLDNAIDSIVKRLYPNTSSFKKSIQNKKNSPTIIKLNLDDSSVIFNDNNDKIDIKHVTNNNISVYIELQNVVIANNTCYKKWKILQMKQRKVIDLSKSLFGVINNTTSNTDNYIREPIINPHNNSQLVNNSNITTRKIETNNKNTQQSFRQSFSMNDLLKAKSKLRKTTINDNNKKEERTIKITNPMANLKKVKTKSINIVEQMKEDFKTLNNMKNKLDKYKLDEHEQTLKDKKINKKYKKLQKKYNKLISK